MSNYKLLKEKINMLNGVYVILRFLAIILFSVIIIYSCSFIFGFNTISDYNKIRKIIITLNIMYLLYSLINTRCKVIQSSVKREMISINLIESTYKKMADNVLSKTNCKNELLNLIKMSDYTETIFYLSFITNGVINTNDIDIKNTCDYLNKQFSTSNILYNVEFVSNTFDENNKIIPQYKIELMGFCNYVLMSSYKSYIMTHLDKKDEMSEEIKSFFNVSYLDLQHILLIPSHTSLIRLY